MNEDLIELKNDKFLLENEEEFSSNVNSNEDMEEFLNLSKIFIPFSKFISEKKEFLPFNKNLREFKKILFQELQNLENLD
ncbi:MAG: hypothetical protein ACTSU4_04125 [Promethearchaeota archaeon]